MDGPGSPDEGEDGGDKDTEGEAVRGRALHPSFPEPAQDSQVPGGPAAKRRGRDRDEQRSFDASHRTLL
jgi:hypothetical protein